MYRSHVCVIIGEWDRGEGARFLAFGTLLDRVFRFPKTLGFDLVRFGLSHAEHYGRRWLHNRRPKAIQIGVPQQRREHDRSDRCRYPDPARRHPPPPSAPRKLGRDGWNRSCWNRDCWSRPFVGGVNFRVVRTRRQTDANLISMSPFQVVLRQALANLAGGAANHRVLAGVVIRVTPKNLDAETTLLKGFRVVLRGVLYYVAQKVRTPLARSELCAIQDSVELDKRSLPGNIYPESRQRCDFARVFLRDTHLVCGHSSTGRQGSNGYSTSGIKDV